MKKLGILVIILTILLGGMVSATTCDMNGNGSPDDNDEDLFEMIKALYRLGDLRLDFVENGRVDLSDLSYIVSHMSTPNWCHETLYPILEEGLSGEEQQTTVVNKYYTSGSSGGGINQRTMWYYLTGLWGLTEKFDSFVDYLKTIFFQTKDETEEIEPDTNFRDYRFFIEKRYCEDKNPLSYQIKDKWDCINLAVNETYGEGCLLKNFAGVNKIVCP